jgi:hypothetical protein
MVDQCCVGFDAASNLSEPLLENLSPYAAANDTVLEEDFTDYHYSCVSGILFTIFTFFWSKHRKSQHDSIC